MQRLQARYFLLVSVFTGPPISTFNDPKGPYTSHFFVGFSVINVAFLILLGVAAIRLLRVDLRGIELLAITLKLELIYWFLGVAMWLLPAPFGMSAAGATGIGNMGIAPQLFIAYPITGLIAIWALKKFGALPIDAALHRMATAAPTLHCISGSPLEPGLRWC